MTRRLRIALDNSQALYFPGQNVSGKVFICNDEELEIKGVSIKFSGESQTKWIEGAETHSANEVYYVKRYFLLGNGSDIEIINPGEHIYRFSFKLPLNIPSSYETHTGQVRHQCKAKVHRCVDAHWEVVRPFSVNTLYDLNLDEDAKLPVEETVEKSFTLSSGSMSITLLMERTGFVPGEKLRIHCEVNNDSNKDVKYVKLELIKDAIYHASSGATLKYTMTLAKYNANFYINYPGKNVIWSNTGPIVPAVPPSYLQHCNIIDMRYTLKIILSPSGFRREKIELSQPIIIGSIPLAEHFRRYRSRPQPCIQSSNPRSTTHSDEQSSNPRSTTHSDEQSSNPGPTSHIGAQFFNPGTTTDLAEQFSNLGPTAPPLGATAPPLGATAPPLSAYASAVTSHANSSLDPYSDDPPPYNPDWGNYSEEPPIHPGLKDYPEMPPPSYIESQHSAPNNYASNSNGTPQSPFIPSYLVFNPCDSRPGTPTIGNRKLPFV